MRLIIAEKPSVGRALARALGVKGKAGKEYIEGRDVLISWCLGHLGELAMPEDYDAALKKWSWSSLPILPDAFRVRPRGGKGSGGARSQLAVLRRLLADRRVTEVVNACDSGREGELIFDFVIRLTGCRKPVLRLWTPSMTDEALRRAYREMKPGAAYHALRAAARARAEADWLVGINATRAQTLRAREAGVLKQGAFSIGRVQTPTLKLIYDRDEAIRTFVPEDFWTVHAEFSLQLPPERTGTSSDSGPVNVRYAGQWYRKQPAAPAPAASGGEPATRKPEIVERFGTEAEAQALVQALAGGAARVAYVGEKTTRRPSEQLYDLTTLQRTCNQRFGFSAEKTLQVAQRLYEEKKVLTYPRTASRHITPAEEAKMAELLRMLSRQSAYRPYLEQILRRESHRQPLSKRYVDAAKVEDHHAILPTGEIPSGLSDEEQKVYDLVVRRTLAMYFPPRVEGKTTVITTIERTDAGTAPGDRPAETFKTTGTVVKEEGWGAVDPPPRSKKQEDEPAVPPLQEGDRPEVEQLYPKKGRTTPPRPYTEADLLGAMEGAGRFVDDEALKAAMKDTGLGTPATRAAIIETLIRRGFVTRRRKQLACTEEGRTLIASITDERITSPELTGAWEAKLARMSRGDYDDARFIDEVRAYTRELIDGIRRATIQAPTPEAGAASHAGTRRSPGRSRQGNGRAGRRRAPRATDKARAGAQETDLTCDRCGKAHYEQIATPKNRSGAFLKCPACGFSRNVDAVVQAGACSRCQGTVLEQDGPYGRYRKCVRDGCSYSESVGARR